MNEIIQSTNPITMTSLELVDFINSQRGNGESELRHDHFMAKVPKVLGEEHAPKFRGMLSVAIGNNATRQSPVYRLPKREACLMAMSYSYELQAKVFDRMTALEAKVTKPDPMAILTDPAALRMVLLGYTEKVIALESRVAEQEVVVAQQAAVVAEQAPQVQALQRIAVSDGAFSLREAAKVLQIREKDFLRLLHNRGWTYRTAAGGRWVAHASTLRQGLMEMKTTTGTKEDGSEWSSSQARVTPKGITKLAVILGVELTESPHEMEMST